MCLTFHLGQKNVSVNVNFTRAAAATPAHGNPHGGCFRLGFCPCCFSSLLNTSWPLCDWRTMIPQSCVSSSGARHGQRKCRQHETSAFSYVKTSTSGHLGPLISPTPSPFLSKIAFLSHICWQNPRGDLGKAPRLTSPAAVDLRTPH